MDVKEQNQQAAITSEPKEPNTHTVSEGGGGETPVDSPPQSWIATNQPASSDQGAGPAASAGGPGRKQSTENGTTAPNSNGVDTGQQQESGRSDFHPPLLRQNSSSLPSFKYLISSVDDPNDKNPIPPIAYGNESSAHASNSSPIRKHHACHVCKKTFPSKNSLSKHKQIHGERSHICQDCAAKFHTKKDLTRHRDTVHGESSAGYVCPVPECPRSNPKRAFSRRDNLRQHILQLHDKKHLDEIKNPQGQASQTEKNASRSPEGGSSPLSDDMQTQTIDEVIEETQHFERIEVRTPMQMVLGEDDLEEETFTPLDDKGKGKAAEYETQDRQPQRPENTSNSHSPQDEPKDVEMPTPGFIVEDLGNVSEQELLPEPKNGPVLPAVAVVLDDASEKTTLAPPQDQEDDSWVVNFLEGVSTAELEQASKLSYDGLKKRFPALSSQRSLDHIRFVLAGFAVGFSRGVQTKVTENQEALSGPLAPTAGSRGSLAVISPSHTLEGKPLLPLTPISATSPTSKFIQDGSGAGFFVPKDSRGDTAAFVIPALNRANTTGHESSKPSIGVKSETTRPASRQGQVATDTEGTSETYKCGHTKCGKTFTKKSEWK
ncbi:hypothetical protein H072_9039 [Dactylellina haptotyla CBS 200.50]|uniref:C2H2-type domain-containing protein n=1 Tax=Dactylellina haptotyla (strain CBS 200.50) TaxID=1284197 RepID=S8A3C8_DACHA|nr:hypothetical protein H072_9039 [Dactylellina haptotyla CBS 200.50]